MSKSNDLLPKVSHSVYFALKGNTVTFSGRFRAPSDLQKSIRVFDFFCGCGGTSEGLRSAGMEIALGLDNDSDAGRTFQSNFPEANFFGVDLRYLPSRSLDRYVREASDHPLLFAACAPCQPFSKLMKGDVNSGDKRFGLVGHVIRFIKRYRPEFLFVENVPGLSKSSLRRGAFELFVRRIQGLGYETEHRVVKSQEYGVPQRRSRLILLASRIGPISLPISTHGPGRAKPTYTTVGDWIRDLPPLSAGETHPTVANHRAAGLSELNLKRIRATPMGGDLRDLSSDLMPNCRRSDFAGFTDVYGRLQWETPAPALTTRCISFSNGRFGHPEQDRALSVREAACLQTFPRDFVFSGNLNSQARQVGNAVPKLLSRNFGEQVVRALDRAARTASQ